MGQDEEDSQEKEAMMYKGVTPTYTFKAPDGLDMSSATKVWVTFSTPDEREILTKTGNELEVTTDKVKVFLSQQETLHFITGKILVQLNWLYNEGSLTKRGASNKFSIIAETNLKNEVLNA